MRRAIPDALDLILTPFLTVIISGFIALLIIGPAGRALGDGISFVLSTLISHAGWLAGVAVWRSLLGYRHYRDSSQFPRGRSRVAGQSFYRRQLPAADLGDGQRRSGRSLSGGVVQNQPMQKLKRLLLPSAFSAMLGITEAAIFGINLRFVKPFIAGTDWRCSGRRMGGICPRLHDRGWPDGDPRYGHRAGQFAVELHYRDGYRLLASPLRSPWC
ncbi:PTS system sac EIIBC component [Leclercia adecarboxylata]|uniref:PTS system sac EIIBC component n=1 Tax=Leclercia adecarboxylata TaxID=83655 RepID=A0A4U9HXE5_9ENTR|nr:PTS system sac EIIBC component [Leclercia adecarboxylata]